MRSFWAFPRLGTQYPALEDQYRQISKLIDIQRLGAEFFFTDGRTDR